MKSVGNKEEDQRQLNEDEEPHKHASIGAKGTEGRKRASWAEVCMRYNSWTILQRTNIEKTASNASFDNNFPGLYSAQLETVKLLSTDLGT